MIHSVKAEMAKVSNQGSDVFHELIESFYGAQNDPGGTFSEPLWREAHNKALLADPSADRLREYSKGPGQPILGLKNMSNKNEVKLP